VAGEILYCGILCCGQVRWKLLGADPLDRPAAAAALRRLVGRLRRLRL